MREDDTGVTAREVNAIHDRRVAGARYGRCYEWSAEVKRLGMSGKPVVEHPVTFPEEAAAALDVSPAEVEERCSDPRRRMPGWRFTREMQDSMAIKPVGGGAAIVAGSGVARGVRAVRRPT